MIKFEWTITLGTLIQVATFLTAAFAIYNRIDNRLVRLETEVGMMYGWWRRHIGFDEET